jgi:Flp pilus assembly protein TadD
MRSSDAIYDQAIEIQQKGDMEGAIAKLRELLQQDPDFPLAHSALSVFYSKLEQYDEAIEHARRVCELEPEDPFSFVAMSLLCQKAGRIAEAERALMQARQAQVAGRQGGP